MSEREAAARRFQTALALFEAGEAMMRARFRAQHPDLSDADIEALVTAWLRERPGAPHGDAPGRPVPWRRKAR